MNIWTYGKISPLEVLFDYILIVQDNSVDLFYVQRMPIYAHYDSQKKKKTQTYLPDYRVTETLQYPFISST